MVSPGFLHLLRLGATLSILPGCIYGAVKLAQRQYGLSIPPLILVSILLLVYPVHYFVSGFVIRQANKWRASSLGAIMAPHVKENSFEVLKKIRSGLLLNYPLDAFKEWAEQHGNTFSFTIFSEYRIFTTEPQHVKAVLATQFQEFGKGPRLNKQWKSLLGDGIFATDGTRILCSVQFHRTMTRPFFSKDRISDFDIFDRHAEDVISQIKGRLAQGYPVEFQDAIGRFTLDSATEYLFGRDVCSLSAGLPYPPSLVNDYATTKGHNAEHPANKFAHAFARAQHFASLRSQSGKHGALMEMRRDELRPLRKVINEFVDPIIDEALERQKKLSSDSKEEGESFLEHLVRNTQDYQVLQDELINLLVAGRDTTASTLTFCVYILSQRPDIVARLRKEVMELVGATRRPSYDDIRDMKYLRAFINETLRLYPVVTSNRATTLPGTASSGGRPIYVPKNTTCIYSVFLIHRRTDLWGPDAAEFDPDRFIDHRLKYLTSNPYIFVPFNAGPRICIGQQFAYNEASFFLIRLLQNFSEFNLAPDVQPDSSKPPASWTGSPGTKGTDKIRFALSLTMSVQVSLLVDFSEVANSNHVGRNVGQNARI
ncbi:cytochrome P450 [Mycena floridula]|nr:cytochrome P450 [Mycena floridula]